MLSAWSPPWRRSLPFVPVMSAAEVSATTARTAPTTISARIPTRGPTPMRCLLFAMTLPPDRADLTAFDRFLVRQCS